MFSEDFIYIQEIRHFFDFEDDDDTNTNREFSDWHEEIYATVDYQDSYVICLDLTFWDYDYSLEIRLENGFLIAQISYDSEIEFEEQIEDEKKHDTIFQLLNLIFRFVKQETERKIEDDEDDEDDDYEDDDED